MDLISASARKKQTLTLISNLFLALLIVMTACTSVLPVMNSCMEEICNFSVWVTRWGKRSKIVASESTFSPCLALDEPVIVKTACIFRQKTQQDMQMLLLNMLLIMAPPPTSMFRCIQQVICQCQCSVCNWQAVSEVYISRWQSCSFSSVLFLFSVHLLKYYTWEDTEYVHLVII